MGIISGTGDRRDEDIKELGILSAQFFDEIIIRCDKNLRGRTPEEIVDLLKAGIEEGKQKEILVKVILNEKEAILYAHDNAKPGSLITIMCDVIAEALDLVKELKEREDREG